MVSNWSLILNVLLLVGVVATIARLMHSRRKSLSSAQFRTGLNEGASQALPIQDEIIAVRKISPEFESLHEDDEDEHDSVHFGPALISDEDEDKVLMHEPETQPSNHSASTSMMNAPAVMMFLVAQENRQLAGYELLQTVLASGLRFGEGQIFHRHQLSNGHGPIMCSLAAATESGVFDLQNIGGFSVRGLCLFMQSSGNTAIDEERFQMMLDTAKQLSEGLDTLLLDDLRRPLTNEGIARYRRVLSLDEIGAELALA